MNFILPLAKDDLEQVAGLYERVMRSVSRTPPPGLGADLQRVLLDHPWADPSVADTAAAPVQRMWEKLGGRTAPLTSIGTWWMGRLVEPFTSKAPSPR